MSPMNTGHLVFHHTCSKYKLIHKFFHHKIPKKMCHVW